ncbi:thioredoxin family protein [Thiolapillus brandeum]|uniref:Thioredoxin domain protein n=1 Tax=Thiolapillus brandeum TaxID=1076588 RepID=A0A7U6JID8_9GAMM|nr:thioredoxin family protein [Thiolapillus brandeum]BAO44752.1 thioredoxin domain protein [Thiolapillus brandeum]
MDDITPYIVFSIIALVIGAQLYIRHKAMQVRGQPASILHSLFPDLPSKGKALVFCHSPGCAPCRAMLPHIRDLAENHPGVYTLDISQHLDLAKTVGIRATPTTLLIRDGRISQVLVGQKKPTALRRFLEEKA